MGLFTALAWRRPPAARPDSRPRVRSTLAALIRPLAALALALAVIGVVLLALGASPAGVFAALAVGAFGG